MAEPGADYSGQRVAGLKTGRVASRPDTVQAIIAAASTACSKDLSALPSTFLFMTHSEQQLQQELRLIDAEFEARKWRDNISALRLIVSMWAYGLALLIIAFESDRTKIILTFPGLFGVLSIVGGLMFLFRSDSDRLNDAVRSAQIARANAHRPTEATPDPRVLE